MNQLEIVSTSEAVVSSGGGGGGGTTYDVSVHATGQSLTSGYSSLSYTNVSNVQHGSFDNGTITTTSPDYSAAATGVSRFTFDTEGIYMIEFCSYAGSQSNGFQFVDIVRNGSTSRDESICYVGIYANYNRKTGTAIRKFYPGDTLTFFTKTSGNQEGLSRILIAKIG